MAFLLRLSVSPVLWKLAIQKPPFLDPAWSGREKSTGYNQDLHLIFSLIIV